MSRSPTTEPKGAQRAGDVKKILVVDDVLGEGGQAGGNEQRRLFLAKARRKGVEFEFIDGFDPFLKKYAVAPLKLRLADGQPMPDLILQDVQFGTESKLGYRMLEWLAEAKANIPVVMLTAETRDENLATATRLGAVDYLAKPVTSSELFWTTLDRYLDAPNKWLVGHHGQFLQSIFLAERFARVGDCLLIQGAESTGKRAFPDFICRRIEDRRGPLWIDARDRIEDESEFLRKAAGRVLAIDGIDFANRDEQSALLALLRAAFASGGTRPLKVIAISTNFLARMVKTETFDRELYDLLSERVLQLPVLHERQSDIEILLRQAVAATAPPDGVITDWFQPEEIARLERAPLPGDLEDLEEIARAFWRNDGASDAFWREFDQILGETDPTVLRDAETPAQRDTSREQVTDVDAFLRKVAAHKDRYKITVDGSELVVLPNVFSPRYSHSSDMLIKHLRVNHGDRVLDVGCGTGVLGIAALKRGAEHATFVDINPDAVENTKLNLQLAGREDRGRVLQSDMLEKVEGRFDLIVSNPPFWDRKAASYLEMSCFDEGYRFLRTLITQAEDFCHPKARMAIVMSSQSDLGLLSRLLNENGWRTVELQLEAAKGSRGKVGHVRVAWICDRPNGS